MVFQATYRKRTYWCDTEEDFNEAIREDFPEDFTSEVLKLEKEGITRDSLKRLKRVREKVFKKLEREK